MHKNKTIFRYIPKRCIYKGTASKVTLVQNASTQQFFAMKEFPKTDYSIEYWKKEKKSLEILSHQDNENINCPYVVHLHHSFQNQNSCFLILDYLPGGSLTDLITRSANSRLIESEARFYFRQLIAALEYISSKNISHLDLKLENLLLDSEGNLKVIDFGLSVLSETEISAHCGTPYYLAPEILTNEYYQGPMADIWASGVILYAMLTGRYPFSGNNFEDLGFNIIEGSLTFPQYLSTEAMDLLSKILQSNPKERFTIEQIKNDTWFKDFPATQPSISTEFNLLLDLDIQDPKNNNSASNHEDNIVTTLSNENDSNQKEQKWFLNDENRKRFEIYNIDDDLISATTKMMECLSASKVKICSDQQTDEGHAYQVELRNFISKINFGIFFFSTNHQTVICIEKPKRTSKRYTKFAKRARKVFEE